MNMLRPVFSFLLFSAIFSSNAQVAGRLRTLNHNGYKILATPDIFNRWLTVDVQQYYGSKLLSTSALTSTNNKPWCVYSDRSRNELITAQNGPTGKFLDFLQPLWVKDVYGQDKLEVCGFEKDANGTPIFKQLGYIKKEKVLLSSYSSLNDFGASRHAMICYALPIKISRNIKLVDVLKGQNSFYLNPNGQDKIGEPTKFRIYFVLKETANTLLLSTKDQISEVDRINRSDVPGWINTMHITRWDHKICLEPNYGSKVESVYSPYKNEKETKVSVPVFNSYEAVNKVMTLGNLSAEDGTAETDNTDAPFTRWTLEKYDPVYFRLPIVGEVKQEDKNIRHVVSIVKPEIKNESGGGSGVEKTIAKLEKLIKKVNILIVIDGSKSMEEYFDAVASSLQSITKNKVAWGFSEVRVGVAIYRDAADAANPSLITLTSGYMRDYEFVKMTDNIESIETFLRESAATYQNINSVGTDRFESMFKGMKRAIMDANFNSAESNYMLLVGDCGNHPTDNAVRIDELVNLIAEKNINIQAYQVHYGMPTDDERNLGANPYLKFRQDIANIIKEVSKKRINNVNLGNANNQIKVPYTFKLELSRDFKNSQQINIYRANSLNADIEISYRLNYTEDLINTGTFVSNTNKSINLYFDGLNKLLKDLKDNTTNPTEKSGGATKTIASLDALCQRIPPEECERFKQAIVNYGDFSAEGFTLTEFYNTGVKAFKTVVFMTVQEKQDLSNRLSNVVQKSGAGTEQRSHFKKAVIDLVGGLMGKNDNVIIEQLTLNDIWEKSMGVKFSRAYEEIGKIPIGMLDQNLIDQSDFENFYTKFKLQVENFKNYQDEQRKGEIGGQTIMWIPTHIFPMCDDE